MPHYLRTLADVRKLAKLKPSTVVYGFRVTNIGGGSIWFPYDDTSRTGPVLKTKAGKELKVPKSKVDTDEWVGCGPGVNVASYNWCDNIATVWEYGRTIWLVKFKVRDVACVPRMSEGKLRLYRCRVVKELSRPDGRKHYVYPFKKG